MSHISNITPILAATDLWYRPAPSRAPIIAGVSFAVNPGETVALRGASGSGKSTLLHLLAGLLPADRGGCAYRVGENVTSLRPGAHAHCIGMMFQDPHLIASLTVLDNVMMKGALQSAPLHATRAAALELLARLGLTQYARAYPTQLSGGEQQRVALARALMGDPQLLLLDEPTAHADEQTKELMMTHLHNFCKERGAAMIVATHDQAIARSMMTRYMLCDGKLLIDGDI